ncbi:rhodanese-like domain-containing protein [Motiliproteus sp.]|uniref:rhodanese-like domain-containing protein n=1 Tax=Motiliproteus sp. TaxID=1898955 RepID=UPI003BAA9D7B
MDQMIEFATNHWELFAALIATLGLLLFTESRKGGTALSTHAAVKLINKEDAAVVDIRAKKDFKSGHITDSVNIPLADLQRRVGELEKFRNKPIIIVCNLGQTASAAVKLLNNEKFENVTRLSGGITEWKGQNLPVVKK